MSQAPPNAVNASAQQYDSQPQKMDVAMNGDMDAASLQQEQDTGTVKLKKTMHVEIKGSLNGFSQVCFCGRDLCWRRCRVFLEISVNP